MGRGGEGGNEASNVEVLLFKVEVALSKVHGHDLSIFIRWTSWQFGWTSLPESRSDDQTTLPPHGDHSTTGASKTAVFVGCYGCLKMPRLLPLVVSTFDIWVGMPWSNMIGCQMLDRGSWSSWDAWSTSRWVPLWWNFSSQILAVYMVLLSGVSSFCLFFFWKRRH